MHKPDPVETILARLMPPALSDAAVADIEAMLDELAGTAAPVAAAPPAPNPWFRRAALGGIAAAGVAAAIVFHGPSAPERAASRPADADPAEFVLVGESERIESTTDEGWLEDSAGSAVHALRLSVVEEDSLLDEETGMVMTVSEPREEILLMPVSTF